MAPAAAQKPPMLLQLARDLNVFVAAYAAITALAGFAIFDPLAAVLRLFLSMRQAQEAAWPLGYALVAIGLIWLWWKKGLSPRHIRADRQTRFRRGHVLLAVFNVVIVALVLASSLGSPVNLMPGGSALVMGIATVFPIAVIAGMVMVLSAGQAAPPVLAPLAVTAEAPRPVHEARPAPAPPPGPAPTRRAASVGLVLAGWVMSTIVWLQASPLAMIGSDPGSEFYRRVVIPVENGVYLAYFIATFALLFRRKAAANWVAWTPFLVIVVMGVLGAVLGGVLVWR